MSTIGDRFKLIRERFKLSLVDFGASVGVSHSHLSKVENGKEKPSDQLVICICEVYCINEKWLRLGEGDMTADITDYLAKKIHIIGSEKFIESYYKLQKRLTLNNIVQFGECSPHTFDDPFLKGMVDYLIETWTDSDRDMQGWLKIQFKNAYPDFEAQKKQRSAVEGTTNGA